MSRESEWFMLGRSIMFALPTNASGLKPNDAELKEAALKIGISVRSARTALAVFNGYTQSPAQEPPQTYPLKELCA